jgi:hypothetical protein
MSRRVVLLKPERHREKVNLPCKARERKDKLLKKTFERKREQPYIFREKMSNTWEKKEEPLVLNP